MKRLRKSSFLMIIRKKRKNFVFSLLSRKLFLLQSSWEKVIREASKNDFQKRQFIASGLLTKTSNYKEEILDYFKHKNEANKERLLIYFTVTSRCDLRCQYCFESHLERRDADPDDIKLFVNLLEKSLKNKKKIKQVELTLFGGEPLLRVDCCRLLLSAVKKICLRRNLSYKFAMTSNGMMVKERELNNLKNCGLTDIQITFDGWKKSHDETRKENGRGYEDLLKNISWLGKSFNLILKYNIRKQNVNDFANFIKDIKNLKLKNITVKLEALQPTLTSRDESYYFSPEDPGLAETYFNLAKIAIVNKLKVDVSSATKPPCMVSVQNSFMVEPDGDISACVSAYKINDLFLGNLRKIKSSQLLSFPRDKIRRSILKAMEKKCLFEECPYFPVCETGCLFVKETLKVGFDVPYCRKKYFNKLIPKLIELKTFSEK